MTCIQPLSEWVSAASGERVSFLQLLLQLLLSYPFPPTSESSRDAAAAVAWWPGRLSPHRCAACTHPGLSPHALLPLLPALGGLHHFPCGLVRRQTGLFAACLAQWILAANAEWVLTLGTHPVPLWILTLTLGAKGHFPHFSDDDNKTGLKIAVTRCCVQF